MSKTKLKEVQESVKKHFGTDSLLMLMGDKQPVEIIPTGIYSMDRALGVGGLPKGRMVEIFGPESTGKTTLALYAVAEAQKHGQVAAFIDAEHSLDLNMAKQIGVNVDELLLSQPDHGEQALELVEHLVRTGEVGIIVIDSVAALTPKAEIDGEMGDSHMGLQARMMSQALRKLVGITSKSSTTIIWINQVRSKIGVFYGPSEVTTGGNALKFYAAMRLEARKEDTLKEGDRVIGHNMKVKVVKNKLASPHSIAIFPLIYGRGVDITGDMVDLAVAYKIITKSGSWYSYGEEKLGQGRNQAVDAVLEKKLLPQIKEKLDEVSQTSTVKES